MLSFFSGTCLNTSEEQGEEISHAIYFAIKCCPEEVRDKKMSMVLFLFFKYLGQLSIVELAVNCFFGVFLHLTTTS